MTLTQLKQTQRTGWTRFPIQHVESVAEHTYLAQFVAAELARRAGESPEQAVMMMMAHDMVEALTGDLVAGVDVPAPEKKVRERQAAQQLAELAGHAMYQDLFAAFEANETPLARLCHDADKIEMALQALLYEQYHAAEHLDLREFWQGVAHKLQTPHGETFYRELCAYFGKP